MKLYCKSYWVYAVKDFIGYLFSLYYCCFTCLRLAKPKMRIKSKCPNDIDTEWAIPEKRFKFHFTPENSISLTIPSFPLCSFFFYYNVFTVIFDCNHPFDTSIFTHSLNKNTFLAIENKYLNGVFLRSKIFIFP